MEQVVGQVPRLLPGAQALGPAATSNAIAFDVALQPRDPAALASYVQSVSTPGSSMYHHYLARGTFASTFGPTPTAIAGVQSALQSAGFDSLSVSSDGLLVQVASTVGQAEQGLHLGIDSYQLTDGRTAYANTTPPELPASVAGDVISVVGLDDLYLPTPAGLTVDRSGGLSGFEPAPGTLSQASGSAPTACAAAAGVNGAYTATQLAQAYDLGPLYGAGDVGAGVTAAVFELSGAYSASNVATYQSCYGTNVPITNIAVDGGTTSTTDEVETELDIETLIGLSPGLAKVEVYDAPNTGTGSIEEYDQIATDDSAKVVSVSYGLCEPLESSTTARAEETEFEEMAAQGQTILAATGDAGSEACYASSTSDTGLAVNDPASDPYVTGVGGTDLTGIGASPSTPPTETVWNEGVSSGAGAGGGGISSLWAMPSYQAGIAGSSSSGSPCAASSGNDCREVPDVTASADPYHGYATYTTLNRKPGWYSIGGTSGAAPLWNALISLGDADPACASPVGFLNPTLYRLGEGSGDFNDITTGENDYLGTNGGQYSASGGYDLASGLGSPIGARLAASLCGTSVAPPLTATTTRLASSANPSLTNQAVTYTATVSPVPNGGTVAFTDDGTTICAAAPVSASNGSATCAITYTVTGSHSIVASYSGDASYASSTSPTLVQVVNAPAPMLTSTTTGLVSSSNPSTVNKKVTYTASVTPVPNGSTITFTDNGIAIGGCAGVSVSTVTGRATCAITYTATGSHSIVATYSGDSSYASSTSPSLPQVVSAVATSTRLTSSANPSRVNRQVTYTATVSPVPNGGTITFTDNAVVIGGCSGVSVSTFAGQATCAITYTATGSHSIVATYSGNSSYASSSSPALTLVVESAVQR